MKKNSPALWLGLLAGSGLLSVPLRADEEPLPGTGFAASHYETLWTKSPFAVASSDAPPEAVDYTLVGIAQFDGVSYASLIEKQNQEHFLLSGNKPVRGLTLVSVTRGQNGAETTAVVQKNGETLTLKLEPVAANGPSGSGNPNPNFPTPQILMPGANLPMQTMSPGNVPGQVPPMVHFRRLPIHFPPNPGQVQPYPMNQPGQAGFNRPQMIQRYPTPSP